MSFAFRDGVLIISPAWRYELVSDSAAEQRRVPREALEHRALAECHADFESGELFRVYRDCLRARKAAAFEQRLDFDDGTAAVLELHIEAYADGLVVTSVDLTAYRGLLERLGNGSASRLWAASGLQPGPAAQWERVSLLEDRRVSSPSIGELLSRLGYLPELTAGDPLAFLEALSQRLPRVAVIDLSHRKRDRIWVVRTLARRFPQLRILAVSPGSQVPVTRSLKLLGASEVIAEQPVTSAVLRRAVSNLLGQRGERESKAARRPLQNVSIEILTPREREVLSHIATGADNLRVSASLGIAERTVKAHLTNIFRKLGAENRVELALVARGLT